ncbi:MAG: tyrosine--tRNA ligase [Thermaerobacter sp.]|nr:tyrosine--tRNA ligase [Thermaerobacter sp.]
MIEEAELREKLLRGRPLTVKLGIDTTAPVITLGHAVAIRRLAAFQRLGHRAVFLIGDETSRVGDPTGRNEARPPLTAEEIEAAAGAFLAQIGVILDLDRVEVRRNSEWLRPLGFTGALQLASHYTLARMLEREDFLKRFKENRPIHLHELLYPLMQGYDSVALRADVELGATEQKFNLLVGRQLQREDGQEPQVLIMHPILTGLDGEQKMGKSLGNYVAINDPPDEMFGKLMSIPDRVIPEYVQLAADRPDDEVQAVQRILAEGAQNPRDLKADMAERTVALYYGVGAAEQARRRFDATFREHTVPDDAPSIALGDGDSRLVPVLVRAALAKSSSDARRLVADGAVRCGEEKLTEPDRDLLPLVGSTLRVGKHRFLKLAP